MLVISITLVAWLSLFFPFVPAYSAAFNIPSGDVQGLIAAINAANANGEENTINLEPGTYTLTGVDNNTAGPSGLPSITSRLTIQGVGAETTIIERDATAPTFRILHVADEGNLTIEGLTIRGGVGSGFGSGGAINAAGPVTITDSNITENRATPGFISHGGGIFASSLLTVTGSTISRNVGGGIVGQTIVIANSSITDNVLDLLDGAGINGTSVTITNSTIARNRGLSQSRGGVTGRTVTITNSTVPENSSEERAGGIFLAFATVEASLIVSNSTIAGNSAPEGDIFVGEGTVTVSNSSIGNIVNAGRDTVSLQNTILGDCRGPVTSLGNNIIESLRLCEINLQPFDLTGDPGLGSFIDDGTPGGGRFPLLAGSPAINAGNDAACPPTDQLDTKRSDRCDIGAIEFYPVVNDLVAIGNLSTAFNPTPVPGGPAGTFRIIAEFTNTSNQVIVSPFVEVTELTGGNLLLNADSGPGGVGARVTPSQTSSTPLLPGAIETFEFVIGLQKQEPFTFFVNMLGDPKFETSVSMRQ